MNIYAIVLAVVTCFSTLLGGAFAARRRRNIGILGAFAAGVLIATSLLDLIPETLRLALTVNVLIDDVMGLTVVGFIFLYIIGRLLTPHGFRESERKTGRRSLGGFFATTELSAHSFIDGLAIGFGFDFGIHVGIIIALAVICHDFSDGLSAVTVMLNSGNSIKNSIRMLFLDAVAPILGAIVTLFIQISQYYMVLLLPFFAGGFLYLGASDLLPQAHEKNPQVQTVLSSILGFALIFVLTRILSI